MSLENIALISFGHFEEDFLEKIGEGVTQEFLFPVKIIEGHLDLSEFYDPVRGQYNGNKLLKVVDDNFSLSYFKTFGLFHVDLYIPILTYIFGQAFLNGRTGIGSIFRLSNERYGMKTDKNIIHERLVKEVIHELGHTFGLIHCHIPSCVMRSSTYVEDIDQKSQHLCSNCQSEIRGFLNY
ncbi:MAG: archaemetzincin family Zn-dependent metalloprotease [Bacteroidota bacterium]